MATEKTDAIVLRVVDFSETSCIVSLYTRDFGKVSAIAKGARRRKSPFEAALDLLALCRIVFVHKTSESLDILTEAKLQRRFRSASTDLKRLYSGLFVIELLQVLTDEGDANPKLFELALESIQQIDESTDAELVLIRFQIRALGLLGHGPELHACVGCGQPLEETKSGESKRIFFGMHDGGVLCTECRRARKAVVSVSQDGIKTLRNLADPNCDRQRMEMPSKVAGEIGALTRKYISHLIGFEPKLVRFLDGN